jgi:alkanesulfonate monooxygenase SsuD/methylene tetrahydromethanopterin reductase-like flavin-dependent oxidoreductase (luciferase family)
VLSKGRVLFGVGNGWNIEEMANHGTREPERRGTLLRERIEAMQRIWAEKQAEYHGKYVDFDPIFAWPKPVQKPHPPIHVGGAWPHAAKRAIAWGNGWIPVGDWKGALRKLPEFRELAQQAGRDPASLEVSVYYGPADRASLEEMRDGGIARAVFGLPSEPADKLLPLLDHYRKAAEQVG